MGDKSVMDTYGNMCFKYPSSGKMRSGAAMQALEHWCAGTWGNPLDEKSIRLRSSREYQSNIVFF